MNKIKIVTDSTVDLPLELIEKYNIEVLPMLINFGEESYLDGVELTCNEMQDRINRENVLPTTSQVTPNRFQECFEKNLKEGYKILAITISSKMSGTYQSACIAKDMIESDDIVVIDSNLVTLHYGMLVIEAAKMIEAGKELNEIVDRVCELRSKVKSSLSFESLENLVRGGRLSKTVGTIGAVLGLRLILDIEDGEMAVKDKVRGSKKALKKIISDFEACDRDENIAVGLLDSYNEDIYQGLKKYLDENNVNYFESKVGCTVGIHAGPKACGLIFISK